MVVVVVVIVDQDGPEVVEGTAGSELVADATDDSMEGTLEGEDEEEESTTSLEVVEPSPRVVRTPSKKVGVVNG